MQTKTGIIDLFWNFWKELYVAENLPLIHKNKRHVIFFSFDSTSVKCHKCLQQLRDK